MTEENFKYDVFISYSSIEKDWVRNELLTSIEKVGLKACIDFRDFERGAPSVVEMEQAVKSSKKTLLVLTDAYLASGWAEFESLMLQTLDPGNRDRRLIPLLKEKCNLPTRIGYLTYIDFSDPTGQELAWYQLFASLGRPQELGIISSVVSIHWNLVHPYGMPTNFTGRLEERNMLSSWLNEVSEDGKRSGQLLRYSPKAATEKHPLLLIRGLGGFGKTALVWNWLLNDVDKSKWQRVLYWSFYEGESSFEKFLFEALQYLSPRPKQLPNTPQLQAEQLLELLKQPGSLLILDGFERCLRAFGGMSAVYQGDEDATDPDLEAAQRDCVSPAAEFLLYNLLSLHHGINSKVLMTSRLRPRVLESRDNMLLSGCREEELTQLELGDAVEFFYRQGVRGSYEDIATVCDAYGCHPLSLRLLVGLIIADLRFPGNIAVVKEIDIVGDLKHNQHHVLAQAYNALTPLSRKILNDLACFRFAVDYDGIKGIAQGALSKADSRAFESAIRELLNRGLLHRINKSSPGTSPVKFDLHPIVRRYVYDHIAQHDRRTVHAQIRDYFAAVPPAESVDKSKDLETIIELYYHTVSIGRFNEAYDLFRSRLATPLYRKFADYQSICKLLEILFPGSISGPPIVEGQTNQTWVLNQLALAYAATGRTQSANKLFEIIIDRFSVWISASAEARILTNMVQAVQVPCGLLKLSRQNLDHSIELSRFAKNLLQEAIGHRELGWLLGLCGDQKASKEAIDLAKRCLAGLATNDEVVHEHIATSAREVQLAFLFLQENQDTTSLDITRERVYLCIENVKNLINQGSRNSIAYERDLVTLYWLSGVKNLLTGDWQSAEKYLADALTRCRATNFLFLEVQILLDFSRLHFLQGAHVETVRLLGDGLRLSKRCGYILQEADMHLLSAELALMGIKSEDDGKMEYRDVALMHAKRAHELSTCDGLPQYTYKVAFDRAVSLLKTLEKTGNR